MAAGCGGLAREAEEAVDRQGGRSCRHACGDGGDARWGQVLVGGRGEKVKNNRKGKKEKKKGNKKEMREGYYRYFTLLSM
jgi:hypothetical protein